MGSLSNTFNQHAFVFWLALVILVLLVGIWVMIVQRAHSRLAASVHDVFDGVSGESTARMLVDYLSTVRTTAAQVDRIRAEHESIQAIMPSVVRHIGLVRFSPFHDTGGDQSFTLALLDGKGDGIVVTALHSRNDSRLYAKPIERGESPYSLAPEEREAMARALNQQMPSPVAKHRLNDFTNLLH